MAPTEGYKQLKEFVTNNQVQTQNFNKLSDPKNVIQSNKISAASIQVNDDWGEV